jgi:hypothetical protein
MAISQMFDDLLKDPRLLPDESAIAVHFKGGHGGILFGFDTHSRHLASGHHILPHAGALAGYDVTAVVEEARRRASSLLQLLPLNSMPTSQDRYDRHDDLDHATPQTASDRSSLPPWPWR